MSRNKAKGPKESEANTEEDTEYAVIPPNGGWGWMVVACAFYCNVIVDGIQLTFGVFLEEISKSFNVEYSKVALAGSLMFGTHLLMGPVCASFSSVFGLRPVTITGSIICSFGVGLAYFATGYWYLYFTYGIVGGMGLGLIYMNSIVITGVYFTTLMPIAMGIVVCGTGVGTMVFAGLGYFLLSVTTWQISFLIQAVLASTMGLAAIAFKPLKPIKVKLSEDTTTSLPSTSDTDERTSKMEQDRRESIFIKRDVVGRADSTFGNRTYPNKIWDGYLEQTIVREIKRKRFSFCNCIKCDCKRKKKLDEDRVLILTAAKNDRANARRMSYVEKMEVKDELIEEEQMENLVGETSSITSSQSFFDRIYYEKKDKNKNCTPMRNTLLAMVDCRLLRSLSFFMFTISGALQMASLLIVYVYEKDRCKELGFSDEMSIYFVISLGGANVLWRLLLGGIATIPKINYQALAISGIVIGGVATMCSGLSDSVYYQFAFCFFFGLGMASFAVFRLLLLLDIIEVKKVENATGINLLFMGLTCITFPPLFGWAMEMTHSYNVIFLTTGFIICLSGFMLCGLKKLREKELRKVNQSLH